MNSKEKFTGKVAEYVKYRPGYPQKFIDYLFRDVGLDRAAVVADIGAGTGILTRQLGGRVRRIDAVEPNAAMRAACEAHCRDLENVVTVDGSAEDTTLPDHSVDFITVAQAFHWFDRDMAELEFRRILKPHGKVILVWNRRAADSELVQATDALFQRICPDFGGFSGGIGTSPETFRDFFRNGSCEYKVFDNDRVLTLESYIGSNLSTSYAPAAQDETRDFFVAALTELFHRYSRNGQLLLPNKTHCYIGEV
jgi:SAM-dependent methyltransferase